MSDPQQSWNRPGQQPWGQQPPPPAWSPQQGPPGWGPAPAAGPTGSTPLLVLGLVTAVLGLLGTVLPSVDYPNGIGYYGPLLQSFGDGVQFLAGGLVLLAAVGLLVAGALVQRRRSGLGTGLLLVGGGMVAEAGVSQLFALLQAAVATSLDASPAVGGILLSLAGCTAVAVVVVGLVRVARLR